MSESRNDRGPRDRTSINMNDGFEVRYWSSELSVSAEQLRSIVRKVGPKTDDVRGALASAGHNGWRA